MPSMDTFITVFAIVMLKVKDAAAAVEVDMISPRRSRIPRRAIDTGRSAR